VDDRFDSYGQDDASLADIMERALDAIEAEHDTVDLTFAQQDAERRILSWLESYTWPGTGSTRPARPLNPTDRADKEKHDDAGPLG
jgi:hypothetical protein